MTTLRATYHAPEGDDEVVKMFGLRFIDGETISIDADEHPHAAAKLRNNQHFTVTGYEDDGEAEAPEPARKSAKPKRGRAKGRHAPAVDPEELDE